MHEIKVDEQSIKLPSQWNELNKKQLLYIAEYIDIWQTLINAKISLGKSKAMLLFCLLNTSNSKIFWCFHFLFRPFFSKRQKAINALIFESNENDLFDLLKLTNFVFEKNTLTKNLIPYIKIRGKKYYGPADDCDNLRFGEFVYAEEFFKAFCSTSDEKYLLLMVATLYRLPKEHFNPQAADTDGDIREPFNNANLEYRAKALNKLSAKYKKAIMLFYVAFREKMVDDNPEIFPQPDGETAAAKGKSSWADVLIKMARTKRMDDQLLEKKLMSTILMELTQIAEEQKQLKK